MGYSARLEVLKEDTNLLPTIPGFEPRTVQPVALLSLLLFSVKRSLN